ncbi:hypothetical protein J6590_026531 [Homalodisca vitripennis]|nr:hypothetical protein J6590_026531 [Homalodisca vitripennis]
MVIKFFILCLSVCTVGRTVGRSMHIVNYNDCEDESTHKTTTTCDDLVVHETKITTKISDHSNGQDNENTIGQGDNENIPTEGSADKSQQDNDGNQGGATNPSVEEASESYVLWYYFFPWFVYFLITMAAVILLMVLYRVIQCFMSTCPEMCPVFALIPCSVGVCHRTTVAEEKDPNCRTKDKLQLSLVNVNKHYYKLEGSNVP